jgi:hypothetical protein
LELLGGKLAGVVIVDLPESNVPGTSPYLAIDARVTKPGSFGHNYFYSNPAVSSDLNPHAALRQGARRRARQAA